MPYTARVRGGRLFQALVLSPESVRRPLQTLRCPPQPAATQPGAHPTLCPAPAHSWSLGPSRRRLVPALHSPSWSSPPGPRPCAAQTGVGARRTRAAPMPAPRSGRVRGSGPQRLQRRVRPPPPLLCLPGPPAPPPAASRAARLPAVASPSPRRLPPASVTLPFRDPGPSGPPRRWVFTTSRSPDSMPLHRVRWTDPTRDSCTFRLSTTHTKF